MHPIETCRAREETAPDHYLAVGQLHVLEEELAWLRDDEQEVSRVLPVLEHLRDYFLLDFSALFHAKERALASMPEEQVRGTAKCNRLSLEFHQLQPTCQTKEVAHVS